MLMVGVPTAADCPPCGPDYCHGDSRYGPRLTAKKTALSQAGYPADLVALMDRGGECVASVDQAPDAFSIKVISGSTSQTIVWTRDAERIARGQLVAGTINRYYKFNAARAFACCGDAKAEDRADWNAVDGVNAGQAILCRKTGSVVQCS